MKAGSLWQTGIFVLVLVLVVVLESVPCPSAWNGATALEGSRFGAGSDEPTRLLFGVNVQAAY
jgi:hypothetical protein